MKNFSSFHLKKMIGLLIIIFCLGSFMATAQVNNITHTGAGSYATIQAAINNTATVAGDVLQLTANVSEGLIIVNKAVVIDGNGFTVSSTSGFWGINPTVPNISILNLTIQNAGTFGINTGCGADNLVLTDITVKNCGGTGVGLHGSDNAVLTNFTALNNGGNGISITDCDNTTINGITTSGNTFGGFSAGIGLFTSGAFCPPAGINGFTLTGAISIAEPTVVYSQKASAGDVITGLSGASISWAVGIGLLDRSYWPDKTTAYAVVDVLFEPPFSFPNTAVYVAEVASENFYVDDDPAGDASPPMLIQTAINFEVPGKTIFVEAGTYNEAVNVNKVLTISGAGSGAGGTIITNPGGTAITLGAGTNSTNRVIINNMRLTGSSSGVVVNSYNTLDNIESVSNTVYGINLSPLNDLIVTNSKFNFNNVGLKLSSTASATNVSFTDCEFNNNAQHGWYADASSSVEPVFDNVMVTNTTFNNNVNKGIYTERLSNAIFNNITVNNSGVAATNHSAGIDINLKWRMDYTNIQILNSTISNCGTGDANGGGILIKARSDGGTYGANPATLNNVILANLFVTNNGGTGLYSAGIRIGEANNSLTGTNTSPTNVSITECSITGNSPYAIRNATTGTTISATCNWYGSTVPATVAALINGSVTYFTWLTSNFDNSGSPGFQPAPNTCSGCPSGNVIQNLNTLEYFCSIQSAINAPATLAGHTISVGAGTYGENVTVNKSITLRGANANVACGSRGTESIIAPASGVGFNVTASGVTINGFEVTTPTSTNAISIGGSTSNTNIIFNNVHHVGNTITNANVHAIVLQVANLVAISNVNISDNCINNISSSFLTGNSASAIGILHSQSTGTLTTLNIERNIINDVNVNTGLWPIGKVAYGIVINTGSNPAYAGSVIDAIIKNNEISNLHGHISHAIGLEGPTPNAIVINNKINNLTTTKTPADAVGVMVETNTASNSISINNNSFTNLAFGIVNVSSTTPFNGTCNWYGTTISAAVASKIAGNVTYTPWLTSGVDASPAIGFQPSVPCVLCTGMTVSLGNDRVVLFGIPGYPGASGTFAPVINGAPGPYTYLWSGDASVNGLTTPSVTPSGYIDAQVRTYTVSVTAANGCTVEETVIITYININCSNNANNIKVKVCHRPQGNTSNCKTICVSINAVQALLDNGSYLGICLPGCVVPASRSANVNIMDYVYKEEPLDVKVLNNPTSSSFRLLVNGDLYQKVNIRIVDIGGRQIEQINGRQTNNEIEFGNRYISGIYLAEVTQGSKKIIVKLVKAN